MSFNGVCMGLAWGLHAHASSMQARCKPEEPSRRRRRRGRQTDYSVVQCWSSAPRHKSTNMDLLFLTPQSHRSCCEEPSYTCASEAGGSARAAAAKSEEAGQDAVKRMCWALSPYSMIYSSSTCFYLLKTDQHTAAPTVIRS